MKKIGVLAVQGDFEKHIYSLVSCGVSDCDIVQVRTPTDLSNIERLILPGGESTTVGLLLKKFGLGEAIIQFAQSGKPIWGTCMGMILMGKNIEGREQYSLGLLDITVKRNAFGRQIYSFTDKVDIIHCTPESKSWPTSANVVFIRAPEITEIGPLSLPFVRYKDRLVGVIQGRLMGTSFHPELTDETWFHELFLSM